MAREKCLLKFLLILFTLWNLPVDVEAQTVATGPSPGSSPGVSVAPPGTAPRNLSLSTAIVGPPVVSSSSTLEPRPPGATDAFLDITTASAAGGLSDDGTTPSVTSDPAPADPGAPVSTMAASDTVTSGPGAPVSTMAASDTVTSGPGAPVSTMAASDSVTPDSGAPVSTIAASDSVTSDAGAPVSTMAASDPLPAISTVGSTDSAAGQAITTDQTTGGSSPSSPGVPTVSSMETRTTDQGPTTTQARTTTATWKESHGPTTTMHSVDGRDTETPLSTTSAPAPHTDPGPPRYEAVTVLGVNPSYGPLAGGTVITIRGRDMPHPALAVWVEDGTTFNIISSSASEIIVQSRGLDPWYQDRPLQIDIAFPGGNIFRSPFHFVYKENPTLLSIDPLDTIPEGGLTLTVTGQSLMSVAVPKLKVTTHHVENPNITIHEATTNCEVLSDTEMECVTPAIALESPESCDNNTECRPPVPEDLVLSLGVIFDGFLSYEDLRNNQVLGKFGELRLHQRPTIPGQQDFAFGGDRIEFQVYNFNRCCNLNDVWITVGQGDCTGVTLVNTTMSCLPPPNRPPRSTGMSKYEAYPVRVHIGTNLQYHVGSLRFVYVFPDYLIAICVIAGFILLVNCMAFGLSCARRERKRRAERKRRRLENPKSKRSRRRWTRRRRRRDSSSEDEDVEAIELGLHTKLRDIPTPSTMIESRDISIQVGPMEFENAAFEPSSDEDAPPIPHKLTAEYPSVETPTMDTPSMGTPTMESVLSVGDLERDQGAVGETDPTLPADSRSHSDVSDGQADQQTMEKVPLD